jgi:hypothetical protein
MANSTDVFKFGLGWLAESVVAVAAVDDADATSSSVK